MSIFHSRTLLSLSIFTLAAGLAAPAPPAHAEAIERTANGVIVHVAKGVVQVEVCSDRVVHVLASAAGAPAKSVVPAVIGPCSDAAFTSSSDDARFHIETLALKIDIDRVSGSVRFLRAGGDNILSEQPRQWQPVALAGVEGSEHGIEQQFQLSPGEALYGLGQHQEGFLNLRDIPLRLLQANTNIVIPFLVSTKGYGLLWNNAALTDFNPATDAIKLDDTGAGTFQTGAEGEYGFLLNGNFRDKLRLSVNGEQIVDIKNMWVAASASGKIHLAANTTY